MCSASGKLLLFRFLALAGLLFLFAGIAVFVKRNMFMPEVKKKDTVVKVPHRQESEQLSTLKDGNGIYHRVVDEFPIDMEGGHILLPVNVNGEDHKFVLDTGCSHVILDISLKHNLGRHVTEGEGNSIISPQRSQLDLFEGPKVLRIGSINLMGDVGCKDLKQFDFKSDYKGIVGMSVLKYFTVQLDFDKGKITFLEIEEGQKLPLPHQIGLFYKYGSIIPHVRARIFDDINVEFMIDTGLPASGFLEDRIFEEVLLKEGAVLLDAYLEVPSGGTPVRAIATDLSIEGLRYKNIGLFEQKFSSLGMDFLERHSVVVLDFPHNRLYLQFKNHNQSAQKH